MKCERCKYFYQDEITNANGDYYLEDFCDLHCDMTEECNKFEEI